MKIEPFKLTIGELATGFVDNQEGGVSSFSGNLDIRPPYQREFVYKVKQRDAVINTVKKGFPLNVMYWAVREDGKYEIIDGQQRTISICQYVHGFFSFENLYFHNLKENQKKQILDYELTIYKCSGSESEKLDWFETINIAGERLTSQELRNAVYSGKWVTDAKRYFSRSNCPAYGLASDYMTGMPIRQEYLETVIDWISDGNINDYMARHQHDGNAKGEWAYFENVISWVKSTFIVYRSEMKGVPWGFLYNSYHQAKLDPNKIEVRSAKLMADDDVSNKKGIYTYLLTNEERHLNIRLFDKRQKREAYERQKGICVKCGHHFQLEEMESDHITPWSRGGKTDADNCQLLCIEDNRRKGGK